jgi:hypothetical protein
VATVFEMYTTEEQRSLVHWAKELNAKYINKEMFPVYTGKCLSRKAIHNWVDKFYQGRLKVAVIPDKVVLLRLGQKQLCSR